MKTATITHENITANGWAFLAADVFIRVDALKADEERQMRECMSNRDNYTIEEIRAVIAHHERNGLTSRANIARAVLAERMAEAAAMLSNIVDVNRAFGRFYTGPRTALFIFADGFDLSEGIGYIVTFDPESGAITSSAHPAQ